MASDARPGMSRHFRGGRLEDDHVYVALMSERDEARADAEKLRSDGAALYRMFAKAQDRAARHRGALERLTKAVHNWNVALDGDDSAEIHAVSGELEAALIAADEALGGSDD